MVIDIPPDHPRRKSLIEREKIFDGFKQGLLAPVASIAHGRGEAFDYLIGEKTSNSALLAIKIAAKILFLAKKPVISVNGNTAILAKEELIKLANLLNCPIEINIFYRTEERMRKLNDYLHNNSNVRILGMHPDARIPNLSSERANCTKEGIFSSDVVFVPLEDGDRCEALRKMDKKVITVDLNPFSRTARTASITIVDNITRCVSILNDEIIKLKNEKKVFLAEFNNAEILSIAVEEIKDRITKFQENPTILF